MDDHPLRGQRLLEHDQVGARSRGTHHHLWPQHVQEPVQSPFQQRHLGLREARRAGPIGTVDSVAGMDEDHRGCPPSTGRAGVVPGGTGSGNWLAS